MLERPRPMMIERRKHARTGWLSTKLHLALIVITILTIVYVLDAGPFYGDFASAILAAAGIYSFARVGESAVQALQRKPPPASDTPPTSPPEGIDR